MGTACSSDENLRDHDHEPESPNIKSIENFPVENGNGNAAEIEDGNASEIKDGNAAGVGDAVCNGLNKSIESFRRIGSTRFKFASTISLHTESRQSLPVTGTLMRFHSEADLMIGVEPVTIPDEPCAYMVLPQEQDPYLEGKYHDTWFQVPDEPLGHMVYNSKAAREKKNRERYTKHVESAMEL
mmetsp:Transcript_31272/g.76287  ORF Transcript_31272/g.76287 Transcript_31272/m.76287 type:complete len:184 (+) Transcript_31272:222-773(+)